MQTNTTATAETMPDTGFVSKVNVDKILNNYASKAAEFDKSDSLFYPVGRYMDEDTSRIIVIGKFIDHQKVYAVDISSQMNATVSFYCLNGKQWQKIGSHETPNDILKVAFKDYDGDGKNEIITEGHYNMNGNFCNEFYHFSVANNTVNYAGSFFAGVYDYEIGEGGKTLKVEYGGSWYMPQSKTIYGWRNEKLIPLRQVTLRLKRVDMEHEAQWIIYEENPTFDKDTLVQKFKKTYCEKNQKRYDLWENFFLNN